MDVHLLYKVPEQNGHSTDEQSTNTMVVPL